MDLIQIILFMLPPYIANSAPVILTGWGPLDRKANFFDKKRLFGDSKTFRGTIGGLIAGFIVGIALSYNVETYLGGLNLSIEQKITVSALLVAGAIFGDLLGSFFKRRLDIESGEPLFATDQLLFILMAILFSSAFKGFFINVLDLVYILIITFVLHILSNQIAHRLNLKKVPW